MNVINIEKIRFMQVSSKTYTWISLAALRSFFLPQRLKIYDFLIMKVTHGIAMLKFYLS